MEKSSSKSRSTRLCIVPVVAWMLLTTTVLLSATSIQSVNASVSWEWDNSTVGSAVADDQEFLMDSQFGNVLAVPPGGRSISSRALQPPPICGSTRYGNCIVRLDNRNRPCGYDNRCVRHSPQ